MTEKTGKPETDRTATVREPTWWDQTRSALTPKGKHGAAKYLTVFADLLLCALTICFILLVAIFIRMALTMHLRQNLAATPVLLILMGLFVLSTLLVGIPQADTETTMVSATHITYIETLIFALTTRLSHPDPTPSTALTCLTLLGIVEALAMVVFCCDLICDRFDARQDRWWLRTVIYPIIGIIFIVAYWVMPDLADQSGTLVYSLAITIVVVDYLMQLVNERLIPREGPSV